MVRQLLVEPYSFDVATLEASFRFETAVVADLAAALRRREGIATLPPIDSPDVVLAAEWTMLWATSAHVLPMAFGQVQSGVGAAVSLALDYFLRKQYGKGARLLASASTLLRIDGRNLRLREVRAWCSSSTDPHSEGTHQIRASN